MIQHTGSLMSAIILPVFPEIRDVPCSRLLYLIPVSVYKGKYDRFPPHIPTLYFTNEELCP